MAGVGFLQSLWGTPIWEDVWPYLDPVNSVCLRTASMGWNVPGKYGPHGELFFFLIQKEPALTPGSEYCVPPFSMPTSAPLSPSPPLPPPFSLLMSSRSARSSPCTLSRKKGKAERMDVISLVWGTNGKWAVQRIQCGKVRAKLGQKTKACLQVFLGAAMRATKRFTSLGCMGLVTRSLFS